jgi:hypothetical protein
MYGKPMKKKSASKPMKKASSKMSKMPMSLAKKLKKK